MAVQADVMAIYVLIYRDLAFWDDRIDLIHEPIVEKNGRGDTVGNLLWV